MSLLAALLILALVAALFIVGACILAGRADDAADDCARRVGGGDMK